MVNNNNLPAPENVLDAIRPEEGTHVHNDNWGHTWIEYQPQGGRQFKNRSMYLLEHRKQEAWNILVETS